jgi:hypothetical protein
MDFKSKTHVMDKSDLQEQLAALYLRLNGFFVSGFVLHAPIGETNKQGETRRSRGDVDVLAVRFPHNREPEREVEPSRFLQVSSDCIDVLICEVKAGDNESPQFNESLRQRDRVLTVLRWIGLFDEGQIEQVIDPVLAILQTRMQNDHVNYREYAVPENVLNGVRVRIRALLFAPDRMPAAPGQTKYIHGQELLDYIWNCLQPEHRRAECEDRYDFGLWGPYEPLVRFFKCQAHKPADVASIYKTLL